LLLVGGVVAEYRLLTIWRIEAPLEEVYAAIRDSPRWPDWWPSVKKVERTADGDADGVNSVWRYCWQGKLPYRVAFEVCATHVEKLVAIEGTARGDLEGVGSWHFARQGVVSVVSCEWHVRSTRWWMNLIAPIARSMFIRNHAQVMEQGGRGLARLLGSPLVGQEHIDLLAKSDPLQKGRIEPLMATLAGLAAGVVATVAQLALWRLAGMPLLETLFRDARLTAALAMGTAVLPPPSTPRWDILLVATLIHFSLSIAYALVLAQLASRLRSPPTVFSGALYGLLIYAINLYGFTLLFPWFEVDRDWVTLVAHLVFGIALAGGYRLLSGKT
jgi:hypothetical protein